MLDEISLPPRRADNPAPLPLVRGGRFERSGPSLEAGDDLDIGLDHQILRDNGVWALDPRDARGRSFVSLRSQLMTRFCDPGGRILAISSTMPREGKTFIAANLAAALSRVHPTVAIDLDLRRPELAQRFGLTIKCGVDDILAGTREWPASAQRVIPGLTIHGARQPTDNPTEMLASERLAAIFQMLRQLPGKPLCIIDTPPALLLDDAHLITRHVDGLMMVIDEGRTRIRDLKKALASLAPATIVGSILNRSLAGNRSSSDYAYYKYYGKRQLSNSGAQK